MRSLQFSHILEHKAALAIKRVPLFETEFSLAIESGSEDKVDWHPECIPFKGLGGIQYFSGCPILNSLVFASVKVRSVLLEAFNPVTTNILLMVLGFLLLQQTRAVQAKKV